MCVQIRQKQKEIFQMYLGGILKTIIQLKGKHHLELAEKEKLCKFPKLNITYFCKRENTVSCRWFAGNDTAIDIS